MNRFNPELLDCTTCRRRAQRAAKVRGFLLVCALYVLLFVLMMAALIYVAGTAPTLQP